MLGIVLARKLREGKNYEDFRAAWFPEVGYGTSARVLAGASILDQREIVTVGFVDANAEDLADLEERLAAAEIDRHDRIGDLPHARQGRGRTTARRRERSRPRRAARGSSCPIPAASVAV